MYYTYVLKSKSSCKHYVGSTADLLNRVKEHNSGKVTSTKASIPWNVIYYEAFLTPQQARQAELFYKTGQGRRQLKKKLNID